MLRIIPKIGPQCPTRNFAVSRLFYFDGLLSTDWASASEPLIHHAGRHPEFARQRTLCMLLAISFKVHAIRIAQAMQSVNILCAYLNREHLL